jgi:hypothetical protein
MTDTAGQTPSTRSTHSLVCEALDRIGNLERMFEKLLSALDEEGADDEEPPSLTLDGETQGGPRDQSQGLG